MTTPDLEQRILAIAGSVLKCEVQPTSSRLDTAAWDSLKHVELVFAIEDELSVQFSEDQLSTLNSIAAIVAAVQAGHAA
jgi:acyl carrier protein